MVPKTRNQLFHIQALISKRRCRAIEVYPVHHLPIIKAYADQLGLVSLINHYVPTAMEVDAGTVVLALSSSQKV